MSLTCIFLQCFVFLGTCVSTEPLRVFCVGNCFSSLVTPTMKPGCQIRQINHFSSRICPGKDLFIHRDVASALVTPFHSVSLAKFFLLPLSKVKLTRETYDSEKKISDRDFSTLYLVIAHFCFCYLQEGWVIEEGGRQELRIQKGNMPWL